MDLHNLWGGITKSLIKNDENNNCPLKIQNNTLDYDELI